MDADWCLQSNVRPTHILQGCSAGGLATYLHTDSWCAALPNAKCGGLPDSGFFLDYQDPTQTCAPTGPTADAVEAFAKPALRHRRNTVPGDYRAETPRLLPFALIYLPGSRIVLRGMPALDPPAVQQNRKRCGIGSSTAPPSFSSLPRRAHTVETSRLHLVNLAANPRTLSVQTVD